MFIMTSSVLGMPISSTHSVIGALLGAGMVGTGASNLNWLEIGYIVVSWFISPAIAALLSYSLMIAVAGLTMNTLTICYRTRIISLQLITAACIVIISLILAQILKV
jgi:PiT family inorganic phosphate transporter